MKYELPREVALLFGLGYANHEPKNASEKDQETCPYCNSYVPLANLEDHFNIHVSKQVSLPARSDLWKGYLAGIEKVDTQLCTTGK